MLDFSEDDLLLDARIMTSTYSPDNFGLPYVEPFAELSSNGASVGPVSWGKNTIFTHEPDLLYSIIQQHSDCIRFLTFAEKSMNAELVKSSRYSAANSKNSSQSDSNYKKMAVEEHGEEQKNGISVKGECYNRSVVEITLLLPLSMDVYELNRFTGSSSGFSTISFEKISLKQLRRDAERDTFKVNGNPLIGSEKGLEGICSVIVQCCNRALLQCCLQPIEESIENDIALEILSKASRTHSGGIAYQYLQYLIKPDNIVIVPLSTLAKPLNINISISSFTEFRDKASHVSDGVNSLQNPSRENKWGLVCNIECSTFFTLKSSIASFDHDFPIDGIEVEKPDDVSVQIMYEDSVCLSVNPSSKCSIESIAGMKNSSTISGRVTIQKLDV